MPTDARYHEARWDAMKTQRVNFEPEWQEQKELILPGAADILHHSFPGEKRTRFLFDTTAISSLQTLAASLMGGMTNPSVAWFRQLFRDPLLKGDQEAAGWLASADDVLLKEFARSNAYESLESFYLHFAAFGTAALFLGPAKERPGLLFPGLRFITVQPGRYCIAEDDQGNVDTLYRMEFFTPRQAVKFFGDRVSKKTVEQDAKPGERDKPWPYLHAVFPREDRDSSNINNKNLPWASHYFDATDWTEVRESGYPEFPYLVGRWQKPDDTPWGFGPGHMALPDIKTLNTLKEMNLLQLELWVQPPLKAVQGTVLGAINLRPLAVTFLQDSIDNIGEWNLPGRPDLVQINQEQLRTSIQNIFFTNVLSELPPPGATDMTATEAVIRAELAQRLLGPAFFRLVHGAVEPMLDRSLGILLNQGAIAALPGIILEALLRNGGQLDVHYEGVLARAQRSSDLVAIQKTISLTQQLAEATQDLGAWDNFDLNETIRHGAEINGMPRQLMINLEEVRQTQRARQQAQAQAQQAASRREDAAAIGKAVPAIQAIGQGVAA